MSNESTRHYSIHPILILTFTTQLKMYKASVQKEIIQYITKQFNHVKKKKKKKTKKEKEKKHGSESL